MAVCPIPSTLAEGKLVVVCFADWKIGGAPSPKKEKKEEAEENKVFF